MDHIAASPIAVVISFIDCINRGDIEGLAALMSEDHALRVFDEPAEEGRERCVEGWRGYAAAFPRYLVLPARISPLGTTVAVLGSTTGSHLGLPDEEESQQTLIWLGEVEGGLVRRWTLIEDSAANRERWGLS